MLAAYLQLSKRHGRLIAVLGLAYASTIVFSMFGPALVRSIGPLAESLSLVALIVHVGAFFLPFAPIELKPQSIQFVCFALLPFLAGFVWLPFAGQVAVVAAYAYASGRVGRIWTHVAYRQIRGDVRGRVVALSLGLAFMLLYIANAVIPSLMPWAAMTFPMATLGGCALLIRRLAPSPGALTSSKVPPMSTNRRRFLFLMLVYVAGGFSYAGIYPHFLPYAHIDRFYSVLPFVAAMIGAGLVLDLVSRQMAFIIGVCCLGMSFTFFAMPSTLTTYCVSQTFLQAGWAFVNAFGWCFSWDMARQAKDVRLFPRGIAAMLGGAALGTMCDLGFNMLGVESKAVFGLVTFVPLFMGIVWLHSLVEASNKKERKKQELSPDDLAELPELATLTPRELEVCCQMVNGISVADIATRLFVSEPTVKTHASRVYKKLNIPSRRKEIQKYVHDLIEAL